MTSSFDIQAIRAQFPILAQTMNGRPLVYLDSAASSQKPLAVLDAERAFYTTTNSNIHRGVYALSMQATEAYDAVRTQVATFMHAPEASSILMTRSATEAFNLLAFSMGEACLQEGDIVLVSTMEHHANLVPWYMACKRRGAILKEIPITDAGEIDLEAYKKLLTPRVRIVAITHVSNVLGTINPLSSIIQLAHDVQARVVVDGSQAIMHIPIDVSALDVDAYIWTGHKIYAPTGTGVCYVKPDLLALLPPWQTGGDMIESVSFENITFRDAPERFEAGTPNIAGVIGLGAAITFLQDIGWEAIAAHERDLTQYVLEELQKVPGLRLIGTSVHRTPVFSFTLEGVHAHDVGSVLDMHGVCVRTGQHCAEPLTKRFGVSSTTRLSCAIYTTREEIDACIRALHEVRAMFG